MANLILVLAIVCASASYAFSTANDAAGNVPNWASEVCSAAQVFAATQNSPPLRRLVSPLSGL